MGMLKKLKFLLITTCVLMHFIGTSNSFHLQDLEDGKNDIVDNVIEITDNIIIPEIQTESILHQDKSLEDTTPEITTVLPDVTTKYNSGILNKIIGSIQKITLRESKSLANNLTIDLPENNEKIIGSQIKNLNSEHKSEASTTELPLLVTKAPIIIVENNENSEQKQTSTNWEENSFSIPENHRITEHLIDSNPIDEIEIQKIRTTAEDLEESVKKSVRDEILAESPIDQDDIDILEKIPDPELRDSVARDILGEDYVRRSQLNPTVVDNGRPDVQYETILTESIQSTESTPNLQNVEPIKPIVDNENVEENLSNTQIEINHNEEVTNPLNDTLESVPEIVITTEPSKVEIITEEPELVSETTIIPIENTSVKSEKIFNVEDEHLISIQNEREGRSMGISNSIRNQQSTLLPIEPEVITTTLSDDIITESKDIETITEISNLESTEETNENITYISNLENENYVEGRSAISSQEMSSHLNSEVTEIPLIDENEKNVLSTTIATDLFEDITTILPQQEGLNNVETENNIVQELTTTSPIDNLELDSSTSTKNNNSQITIEQDEIVTTELPVQDKSTEEENAVTSHYENERVTTVLPNLSEVISESDSSPIKIDSKLKPIKFNESSASDSSESSSSEEEKGGEIQNTTVSPKIQDESEKSDSSESSDESSDESLEKNEKVKFKNDAKPKGRSFSVINIPQLINNTTSDIPLLDSDDSDNSEHMIMKKPSAESEDENILIASRTENIQTTVIPEVILNPKHKVYFQSDETERIPQLIFKTSTVLPLKIFKAYPHEPVRTDDLPNETNFKSRDLDTNISPQLNENIHHLLETESTTNLIAETFTEGVELSKELKRNMNLFRDTVETNRPVSINNNENNSASDDEIMASSSIAEALPNQHIKSEHESSMNPTLVILICVSIIMMIISVIVVTFFRFRTPQGVLDIEMQEQRHGKNNSNNIDDDINNDEHCCSTSRSTTSNVDTLSHSPSCSLITTSIGSKSSKSTSSSVTRSISDCRSDSSKQSISLLSTDLHNDKDDDDE